MSSAHFHTFSPSILSVSHSPFTISLLFCSISIFLASLFPFLPFSLPFHFSFPPSFQNFPPNFQGWATRPPLVTPLSPPLVHKQQAMWIKDIVIIIYYELATVDWLIA